MAPMMEKNEEGKTSEKEGQSLQANDVFYQPIEHEIIQLADERNNRLQQANVQAARKMLREKCLKNSEPRLDVSRFKRNIR